MSRNYEGEYMGSVKVEFKCQCGYGFKYNLKSGFLESIKFGNLESIKCPQCTRELMPQDAHSKL